MVKDLVSIITPCYNGEETIVRLMESIIKQTYRPIEFILIDDGSIDNSYSIAESYKEKFFLANIKYKLYRQENKGLSGAINAGLKLISGEYLCWPDADDYLESTSVEERVEILKKYPEYAVVTSNAYVREASNLKEVKIMVERNLQNHIDSNQFLFHLNAESIFCSGCHMVRTEKFFEVNPDYEIYPARRGQNWQMLLPLYYKYKRYFLNKPLYNYIISTNSMSKGDDCYEKFLYRFNEHEEIIRETLKKIEKVQKADITEYSRFLDDKYAKLRMELAIKYSKPDIFMKEYKNKKINVGIDKADVFNYIRNKYSILNNFLSILYKVIYGYYPSDIPEKQRKKLSKKTIKSKEKSPKVAVLIPVYNGEKFIEQCFKYLINQRYDNVEVIVIDDGSTDKSEELLCKYESIFLKRGFNYRHIYQPNSRLAIAMNNALQYVTADYIMIYEIDDILYRDGILDKVQYLELHKEYGMVRNNGYYINSFSEIGKKLFVNSKIEKEDKTVFERIVNGKANNWPASYMIRKELFFELIGSEHKIYEHPGGCHLQFMMPMAYASKVGFIDKPLMEYYVHIDSDSHKGGIEAAIKRTYQYEEIRSEVVKKITMSEEEKKKYLATISDLYSIKRIDYAIKCKNKEIFIEETSKLNWSVLKCKYKWNLRNIGILFDIFQKIFQRISNSCRNLRCNIRYIKKNSKGYMWN